MTILRHATNQQHLAPGAWRRGEIKVTDRTYEVQLNGIPATAFTADPFQVCSG